MSMLRAGRANHMMLEFCSDISTVLRPREICLAGECPGISTSGIKDQESPHHLEGEQTGGDTTQCSERNQSRGFPPSPLSNAACNLPISTVPALISPALPHDIGSHSSLVLCSTGAFVIVQYVHPYSVPRSSSTRCEALRGTRVTRSRAMMLHCNTGRCGAKCFPVCPPHQ